MVDLYTDDDLEGCVKPTMKQCHNGACTKTHRCRRYSGVPFDLKSNVEVFTAQYCAARCQAYYPKYYEKDKKCPA